MQFSSKLICFIILCSISVCWGADNQQKTILDLCRLGGYGQPESVQKLTEDLDWLRQYLIDRKYPAHSHEVSAVGLAASVTRNYAGPLIKGENIPLQISVVGGAGTGKSTVVNAIVGGNVAEANPQAGFTRHPVAYLDSQGAFPTYPPLISPLQRRSGLASNADEDIYQIRQVAYTYDRDRSAVSPFIVWDMPDMTTDLAYVPRIMEVAGMADVVIYVASDERYNDEVPTKYLHQLLEMGKSVVVVLTKMEESKAQAIIDHFQEDVVNRFPNGVVPVGIIAMPRMSAEDLREGNYAGLAFREALFRMIWELNEKTAEHRQANMRTALRYLGQDPPPYLAPAARELQALEGWNELVAQGRTDFESRFESSFLAGQNFSLLNDAMARLFTLLEPGGWVGAPVRTAMSLVRLPGNLLMGGINLLTGRPPAGTQSRAVVLRESFEGWNNFLNIQVHNRAGDGSHALWPYLREAFRDDLGTQASAAFEERLQQFEIAYAKAVNEEAEGIFRWLEDHPAILNTMRTLKFSGDAACIVGTLATAGTGWMGLALSGVAANCYDIALQKLGEGYVALLRERLRTRLRTLMQETLAADTAEWYQNWPISDGRIYSRLQQVVAGAPEAIAALNRELAPRLGDADQSTVWFQWLRNLISRRQ